MGVEKVTLTNDDGEGEEAGNAYKYLYLLSSMCVPLPQVRQFRC